MSKEKRYTKDGLTVVWKPELCSHSTNCWKGDHGLLGVFNPKASPWINLDGADKERIIEQVKKCPSGALSYVLEGEEPVQEAQSSETKVEILSNGPLLVHGKIRVCNSDGTETEKEKVTAFCRCGASANKPYCDGGHRKINFEG